ncbi:hypothetical protein M9H77_35611 [Catharanthus roseus]|uniref:Uncharacterized protein n=1 Tax=Catharanthus roseus TaxID=4058 RepID=A0ACB9ZQS0_CATRO|nr:hypothetical protein M9H77_35611 [Catharanthus roseus]
MDGLTCFATPGELDIYIFDQHVERIALCVATRASFEQHAWGYFLAGWLRMGSPARVAQGGLGRKRTKVALKGASFSKTTKNALNKHFYTKTAELRMVELIEKPIIFEKRISQDILEQYNVMDLLLGMGLFCGYWLPTTNVTVFLKKKVHLLYVFATKKRINICIVILRNILKQIDQNKANEIAFPCLISEYLLGCRDLFLPFVSWVEALDPLMMLKIIVPGMVPLSPAPSILRHTGPGRSIKQQVTKKKQLSTRMASPSPRASGVESSEVNTSLHQC